MVFIFYLLTNHTRTQQDV